MITIPRGSTVILKRFCWPKMLKVFKNVTERKTNIKLLNKFNFLQERLNGLIIKSRNNYLQTYDKQAK